MQISDAEIWPRGGQGAPLVPAFHKAFFTDRREDRCILNLGGIANLSHLPADGAQPVTGLDTGPANALMDAWCKDQTGQAFDKDGAWASEGEVDQPLLNDMLSDAYFQRPPPKSTGTEKFNLDWVHTNLTRHSRVSAVDAQRTLLELTAITVAQQLPKQPRMTIFACGGGAKKYHLNESTTEKLPPLQSHHNSGYRPRPAMGRASGIRLAGPTDDCWLPGKSPGSYRSTGRTNSRSCLLRVGKKGKEHQIVKELPQPQVELAFGF